MTTIFALSTPPGKSGVAVVRVSGPGAVGTLRALGVSPLPSPRMATLAELTLEGMSLDKALVLYFAAPASFTGEDVVEYHIHGSRAVIKRLLEALASLPGLRPAGAGEFTRRAFLKGKMDLTMAEGLADLIDAETEAQRRQALRFMQGDAAAFYQSLREGILEVLALSEALIDFEGEDIPDETLDEITRRVSTLAAQVESQLADKGAAERVRDGVQVAIIGPPNAGKSSLMNWLAGRDVAIVAHTPGTTRDVIEVHLDIANHAVIVADTAGLREAADAVEEEGIRRSLIRARDADIRIVVLDAADAGSWQLTVESELPQTILLLNKTDLHLPSPLPAIHGITPIVFSVKNRTGMEALIAALTEQVARVSPTESSFVARSRHRHHMEKALAHLRAHASARNAGPELACEELRRAAVQIGKITGEVSPDEVLGRIFSRFCIGK